MPKRLITKYGTKELKPTYTQPEPIAENIKVMFKPVPEKKIKTRRG